MIRTLAAPACALMVSNEVSDVLESSPGEESTLRLLSALGSSSFIEALGSGTIDDADDRSERRLLVRAVERTDGSELAEETDGEASPGDGDAVTSARNFGDGRGSPSVGAGENFMSDDVAVGGGPGEAAITGVLATLGVGGGG